MLSYDSDYDSDFVASENQPLGASWPQVQVFSLNIKPKLVSVQNRSNLMEMSQVLQELPCIMLEVTCMSLSLSVYSLACYTVAPIQLL